MRPPSGEGGRGSLIDFALILILFSVMLIATAALLGPTVAEFLSTLVGR